MFLQVGGDAYAAVVHRDRQPPVAMGEREADDAARGGEFEGVRQQIREHHLDELPVYGQLLSLELRVEDVIHVAVLGDFGEEREDPAGDFVDVLHRHLDLEHAQFGLAVVEHLVDDVQQFG